MLSRGASSQESVLGNHTTPYYRLKDARLEARIQISVCVMVQRHQIAKALWRCGPIMKLRQHEGKGQDGLVGDGLSPLQLLYGNAVIGFQEGNVMVAGWPATCIFTSGS
ncbi:UNVERIFIED_CONTAM: hypothetical protein K2H54_075344 [Gekko kuhli]